jgi:spermidine synthase
MNAAAWRNHAVLMLMVASGFAGLGYQIVWTQQCALWVGHEAAAVLAVVTAFFGGIALGAWLLTPRIEVSRRPERWYAACEATICTWALVLAFLLAPVSHALLALTGDQPSAAWQWGVAFIGTFIVLLPATAAMGATLPAMERVVARWQPGSRRIAALYAGNTLGAVLGVLATAFWLLPSLGLLRTAMVCAALNLTCAWVACGLTSAEPSPATPAPAPRAGPWLWPLALTGALGIGYEVLVVRVLSQVAEDTVYTWALLLAVYLVGSAAGAAAYQRWVASTPEPGRWRDRLLIAQAAACLLGIGCLWAAEDVARFVQSAVGTGMAAALAGEAAMAWLAFALPTLVMGALFSHLCTQAQAAGHTFGRALAFNTLGAAAAPSLCGVLMAPLLGPKPALLIVAAGYLVLAWPRGWRTAGMWGTAAAIGAVAVGAPPLAFVDVPDGSHVLSYRDGTLAAVSVVEDRAGVARLRINNRQQEGSSATLLADARQALLPLLLHPAPQRALFLGLGTGVTARAAAQEAALQVDAVELLPEVIEAARHFAPDDAGAARLTVMAADARRFVRTTQQRYDVVVSDNFHPARSGSGSLYTVEHFASVRERLTPDGVFCQWLPLHQLDLDTLRSIVRSFLAVYPDGRALLATYSLETPVIGLVARRDGARLDLRALRGRLQRVALQRPLADFGLNDDFALLGSFVAGPRALAQFAADAAINTDDRPVVAYRAPRITYAPDSLPRERLLALLSELRIEPDELVDAGGDAAWPARLAAYWRARQRFVEAGQDVRASADARLMLAQVREPLLAVLRLSPDFRPAYDPLLRMASAIARDDPTAAHTLLDELARVQPARSEAPAALARLLAASR